jgi:hypothetical protein
VKENRKRKCMKIREKRRNVKKGEGGREERRGRKMSGRNGEKGR